MHNRIWQRSYSLRSGGKLELGNRTLIMGILNTTPDSFSDGGRYMEPEKAVEHARKLIDEGADIIDIGGESTRPGSQPVPLEEELRRVIPVIEAIRKEFPETVISIDTYKAETASRALSAGADILNDIWSLQGDPAMAATAAEYDCPVILSHNRSQAVYGNLVNDVIIDLHSSIELALRSGVRNSNIWLDPGIGFAKTHDHNLELMGALDALGAMGYPVLLGTSRKLFIRTVLDLPANDVLEGTAATVTLGIAQGCQVVRVHDVAHIARTVRMTDAVVYHKSANG
ncbi:dihydropteroate synthase [Paenibacillus sp. GCM10012307]|uniref:Dihydropteroate synthase n=1 Tax=Paenibacillus roseus TaxID=2798579 RepID=A0A934IXT8_9BACL|nr:dihydropteroate synthase [Paenibacillus roseus]MBJ6361246.1 dihydropteroate synthase [Paenibacillus roseus]